MVYRWTRRTCAPGSPFGQEASRHFLQWPDRILAAILQGCCIFLSGVIVPAGEDYAAEDFDGEKGVCSGPSRLPAAAPHAACTGEPASGRLTAMWPPLAVARVFLCWRGLRSPRLIRWERRTCAPGSSCSPEDVVHHGIADRIDRVVVAVRNLVDPGPVAVTLVFLEAELLVGAGAADRVDHDLA